MSQYGWTNCPGQVREQAEHLCDGLAQALGANLVGVYLHGSLAMGCFNPLRSDIDLLVVTRQEMRLETKRHVAELLLLRSNDPRPIEISFLSEAMLRPWRHPAPYDFHFSEDWRERFQRELGSSNWRRWNDKVRTDSDLAAHVTITLHRGICLFGRPIAGVFPAVPREDYVDSIASDFHWARERFAQNRVTFVLNACRVLACLREGRIFSKREGGEWMLRTLPEEFRALVTSALASYQGDSADDCLSSIEVTRFAEYVAGYLP